MIQKHFPIHVTVFIYLFLFQVIEISSYRTQLYDYLRTRMMAVAPNLTVLLGELVGARLISHSGTFQPLCPFICILNCMLLIILAHFIFVGSLINLAKAPASTLQILGAEKALFRALKTKKDTPKYGLIYHSALVGSASTANKGKVRSICAFLKYFIISSWC